MNLQITKHPKKILTIALLLIATIAVAGWHATKDTSYAADIKNFDPGNIMSDSVMSDKSTMSVQDIQNFLNSKNYCDNRNVHMAAWYPHLKYNIKDGKFVCMARDSFNGKSAAQIIWQTAQDYSINPQFLLVLLEKEQGLVTDTWPSSRQYQTATGYGCPDTAACDTKYFGLENQLRHAASLFRTVLNGGWSNYPVGKTYVQYHPNASCGGSVVNIQNRATSALYRYTPYQPNKSALEAGYGVGDSCGAYGNRNTWRLFTDWFGDPRKSQFTSLDSPRWMQVKTPEPKTNIYSLSHTGDELHLGQKIKFIDKVLVNGTWYLRTEHDKLRNIPHGVPQERLEEISYPTNYTPSWKILKNNAKKYIPSHNSSASDKFSKWTIVKAADSIKLGNQTYIRTEFDRNNNNNLAFLSTDITDLKSIQPLDKQRTMITKRPTDTIKLSGDTCSALQANDFIYIRGKAILGGKLYFSTTQSSINPDSLCLINPDHLDWDIPTNFKRFEQPRSLRLSRDTDRIDIKTGNVFDRLEKGRVIKFSTKININNKWYYRTSHNTENNLPYIIPSDSVEELM